MGEGFEHRSAPVAGRDVFRRRVRLHFSVAALAIAGSLALGTGGYMLFAHMTFVDALLNASMLLSGMGPVGTLDSTAAKLFASAYALYCGVVFIGVSGLLLAPFLHRVLHRLHVER